MSTKEPSQGDTGRPNQKIDFRDDLNRAAMLFELRELGDAEVIYRKILDKDRSQPVALSMLGAIAYAAGAHGQAIDFIKLAIFEDPEFADAHNTLGRVYRSLERHEEAIEAFENSLRLEPDNPMAHYNRGHSLNELKQYHEALRCSEEVMSVMPDDIDNLILKATILNGLDRCDEAIDILGRVLAIDPSNQQAYDAKGTSEALLGRYDQALESYKMALTFAPNDVRILSNLGVALRQLGQYESCISVLTRTIEINPSYQIAQKNLGFAYLASGRIKEGLSALEWRWGKSDLGNLYGDCPISQWDGVQDLKNKTILLWPEQGPQDIIIWSSILPQVMAQSKHCIVETLPKLVPLITRSFPDAEVQGVESGADKNPEDFDTHLPMGSLFLHFGSDLEEPCNAFLVPAPERVAYWQQRLAELGSGPYIGISWKSPVMNLSRAPNYTVIDEWLPVFEKQAVFINLQCGDFKSDLDHVRQEYGVEVHNFEYLDLFDDLDDVAALSKVLDLTISVSTAVAAIAAGVGTETWLLSWKESPWNNILYAPIGPKVINFERSITETWEAIFIDMASRLSDRDSSRVN